MYIVFHTEVQCLYVWDCLAHELLTIVTRHQIKTVIYSSNTIGILEHFKLSRNYTVVYSHSQQNDYIDNYYEK